jgi:hypothetical protein
MPKLQAYHKSKCQVNHDLFSDGAQKATRREKSRRRGETEADGCALAEENAQGPG